MAIFTSFIPSTLTRCSWPLHLAKIMGDESVLSPAGDATLKSVRSRMAQVGAVEVTPLRGTRQGTRVSAFPPPQLDFATACKLKEGRQDRKDLDKARTELMALRREVIQLRVQIKEQAATLHARDKALTGSESTTARYRALLMSFQRRMKAAESEAQLAKRKEKQVQKLHNSLKARLAAAERDIIPRFSASYVM